MTAYSGLATSNSGAIESWSNSTYAAARDGTGSFTVADGSTFRKIGQNLSSPTYACDIILVEFDTTAAAVGSLITNPAFALWNFFNETTTDFTVELRDHDFGASITSADWLNGTALAGKTLRASKSTASLPSDDTAYLTLDDVALAAGINPGGMSRFILCSSLQSTGTSPTNGVTEDFYAYVVDATKGMKLTFDWTPPSHPGLIIPGQAIARASRW